MQWQLIRVFLLGLSLALSCSPDPGAQGTGENNPAPEHNNPEPEHNEPMIGRTTLEGRVSSSATISQSSGYTLSSSVQILGPELELRSQSFRLQTRPVFLGESP